MYLKISDFEEEYGSLLHGEKRLVVGLGNGNATSNGRFFDLLLTNTGGERQIRADFLRAVVLGKIEDAQPLEKGVRIHGARIIGRLDLEGCELRQDLSMSDCRFDVGPLLRSARVQNLFLNGSSLPGMVADGLNARGGVFLRNVKATGEMRLSGAKLGGDLDCTGARFAAGEDGKALNANHLDVQGSVILLNVEAEGEMRLRGAKLGGDLFCTGARFTARADGDAFSADGLDAKGDAFLKDVKAEGEVRLVGARLGGNFECDNAHFSAGKAGKALNLDGTRIEGALFLRDGALITGALDLTGAEIEQLIDDKKSWPETGMLLANGAIIKSFGGNQTGARVRLQWLALQKSEQFGDDFWPQPYRNLEHFYRNRGDHGDANLIAMARVRLTNRAQRRHLRLWMRIFPTAMDLIHRGMNGYGYAPKRSLLWLVLLVLAGYDIYQPAWQNYAFKPTSPVVLRSPEWVLCATEAPHGQFIASQNRVGRGRANPGETQLSCYLRQAEGESLPSFNALAYTIDAVVPGSILSLQTTWVPDETKGVWGYVSRWTLWFQIIAGWVLSFFALEWATNLRGRRE